MVPLDDWLQHLLVHDLSFDLGRLGSFIDRPGAVVTSFHEYSCFLFCWIAFCDILGSGLFVGGYPCYFLFWW